MTLRLFTAFGFRKNIYDLSGAGACESFMIPSPYRTFHRSPVGKKWISKQPVLPEAVQYLQNDAAYLKTEEIFTADLLNHFG